MHNFAIFLETEPLRKQLMSILFVTVTVANLQPLLQMEEIFTGYICTLHCNKTQFFSVT